MQTLDTARSHDAVRRYLDIPIIAAGFLVILPLLGINRTTDFAIFCIFVLGFNILYGFMGRLSFGHMLYLGTGAYTATLFSEHLSHNPLIAILASIVAGALIGVILGPIIVRTTGACFALINLAFCQVGYFLVLVAFSKITGMVTIGSVERAIREHAPDKKEENVAAAREAYSKVHRAT